jgi:Cdc6-like AAA superfamily ATPase
MHAESSEPFVSLSREGVVRILQQARNEEWSELGLLKVSNRKTAETWRDRLVQESGWSPDHIFILDERLRELPEQLKEVGSLRGIDLSGNTLGRDNTQEFAGLRSLENLTELHLVGNRITVAAVQHLCGLKSLRSLDLAENQVGDEGAQYPALLTNLESLDLRNNGIGVDGVRYLGRSTTLRKLVLRGNRLHDQGLRELAASPLAASLQHVELEDNHIISLPNSLLRTHDAQRIFKALRGDRSNTTAREDSAGPDESDIEAFVANEGKGSRDDSSERASQATQAPVPRQPAAPTAVADRPSDVDRLGRKQLVDSLAAMFAAKEQATPFTLALLGDWGSGKSSVLKQLKNQLRELHGNGESDYAFHFATFNAWEYEHTDNIRAGLAQQVIRGLMNGAKCLRRWWLRFLFGWREHRWPLIRTLLLVVAVGFVGWSLYPEAPQGDADSMAQGGLRILVVAGGIAAAAKLWLELKPLLDHPLATNLTTYLKLPDYGGHLGMVPVMKKHIKTLCRIRGVRSEINSSPSKSRSKPETETTRRRPPTHRLIVFVDDLDRCGEQCIVDTLDAIRLVMDIPNVIVVVAIDHRIALRAVAKHYQELADERIRPQDIARLYLGKIFQLTARLERPASMSDFIHKELFSHLSESQINATREGERPAKPDGNTPKPEPPPGSSNELADSDDRDASDSAEQGHFAPDHFNPEHFPEGYWGQSKDVSAQVRRQAMVDSAADYLGFEETVQAFEFWNPRRLIRLRNTMRLLVQMTLQPTAEGDEADPDPDGRQQLPNDEHRLRAMLFWLEYLNERASHDREELEQSLMNGTSTPADAREANGDTVESVTPPGTKSIEPVPDAVRQYVRSAFEQADHSFDKTEFERYRAFVDRFVLPAAAKRSRQENTEDLPPQGSVPSPTEPADES